VTCLLDETCVIRSKSVCDATSPLCQRVYGGFCISEYCIHLFIRTTNTNRPSDFRRSPNSIRSLLHNKPVVASCSSFFTVQRTNSIMWNTNVRVRTVSSMSVWCYGIGIRFQPVFISETLPKMRLKSSSGYRELTAQSFTTACHLKHMTPDL
jgi:hypothetical protein